MPLNELSIEDYNYELPTDRIAVQPVGKRDESRLLIYQEGRISETLFHDLPSLLEPEDLLILNNTRVIPARMHFRKPTGGLVEIFCLQPLSPKGNFQDAMDSVATIDYECFVGGAAKWKSGEVSIVTENLTLLASLLGRRDEYFHIRFSWDPSDLSFAEVLERCGSLPLPPYFSREVEVSDFERYQTVYSRHPGSVAAPTAGLHFTPETFAALEARGVDLAHVTLHVGAGTFKPVSATLVGQHEMHQEFFSLGIAVMAQLTKARKGKIFVVGTTTMRALESTFWLSILMQTDPDRRQLGQWEAYELHTSLSARESFELLKKRMLERGEEEFYGSTSLMVGPGYHSRVADALITNFHLPKSSLLVLVSALVGEDWKLIYRYALDHAFRFLSYGDSSLLWIRK